jgi:ABC-type uncharacterized transport system permease subunit
MLQFAFIAQTVFTALYLAAALMYLKYFFYVDRRSGQWATRLLIAALLVHLGTLAARIVHLGYLPIATVFDALSFSGFIIALAYISIEKFSRDISMGAFISPLVVLGEVLSLLFFSPSHTLPAMFKSHWFEIHVSCSMFAFSSFTIAFIGSILYLILHSEIQRKRPGHFYSRLTSLEQLDLVNFWGSLLGVVFLAGAIFTGFNWLREIHSERLRLDARILASWFTFFVYLGELLIRRFTRARVKTLSYMSIIGFVLVILAFAMEGIIR